MSYNHEPQFNTQSATAQDISDYITMKREWLLYIEGYSDHFPDVEAYKDRWFHFGDLYGTPNHPVMRNGGELMKQAVDYIAYRSRWDTPASSLKLIDEIHALAYISFSFYNETFLLARYSVVRYGLLEQEFYDDTLQEIYEGFRDNCNIVRQCEDCEEYVLDGNYNYINDRVVCEGCTEDHYRYSEYLSEYISDDDAVEAIDYNGNTVIIDRENPPHDFYWDEDEDRWQHDDYEDRSIIGEYHSNRHSYYPQASEWTKKNKRFFGVELEVEVNSSYSRHEKAKQIRQYLRDEFGDTGLLVFERDGSLDSGFEIISQPMGLDMHKDIWKWTRDSTITRGLRSHLTGTCGLHVHVSREGLTNLQIARAVYFVNHQANRHLIETVARRYNAGYCKAKSKKISTAGRAEDRYEMINLQNRKTIEFRIFKGSLKYEAIIAAIEFCHAVLNFAAINSNLHLSTEAFLKFIFEHQQRPDTKFLRAYLIERNPVFRKEFERLVKPEMKKLIPKPELVLTTNAETAEV